MSWRDNAYLEDVLQQFTLERLNDQLDLARQGSYMELCGLVDRLTEELACAHESTSELHQRPFLQAHGYLTLAYALYRLHKDEEMVRVLRRARELTAEAAASGTDVTSLETRLNVAFAEAVIVGAYPPKQDAPRAQGT
ncbi:hypothetical protein JCM10908_004862 [Rhodotorula pacifica]|uniref:uncharacterized protein n=1 Tax=Rhodotorula pacifica TaxID=1495444 RepID=UPI0031817480